MGHQRPVDTAPSPLRQRRTAPQRHERRTGEVADPAGADHLAASLVLGLGNHDRQRGRVCRQLTLQAVDQPRAILTPDRLLHSRDPLQICPVGHLPHVYARRRLGTLGRDRRYPADQNGLLLLRLEAMGDQALTKIIGPVVAMQLPLHLLAALGEQVALTSDQRVQLRASQPAQVAVGEETA